MTQNGHWGTNYYAVQTFSDMPANRRVQMAWMTGGRYPEMPFKPADELSVRVQAAQIWLPFLSRLRAFRSGKWRCLRAAPRTWKDVTVKPGENPLAGLTGDLWDIVAEIEPGAAKEVGIKVRGRNVVYTVKERARDNSLASANLSAPLPLTKGRFRLRVLVDRTSIEVFGNDGEVAIPSCFLPDEKDRSLEFFRQGRRAAKVVSLTVYPMRSIWG